MFGFFGAGDEGPGPGWGLLDPRGSGIAGLGSAKTTGRC